MEIVTSIAPILLALIMLGLGLELTINDFKRVLLKPKDFLVGFFCQIVLLPIIAFGLIKFLNTPIEIAIGVMIIAAAPGGVTSNVLTKFANGDVALSISLTAVVSLISVISVPFIVFTAIELLNYDLASNSISMFSIAIKMFLVVTLPVIIGMLIRRFATNFVDTKIKLIQNISVILFIVALFGAIYQELDNVRFYFLQAGKITLILNILMMFLGYMFAKFFASGTPQKKSIALETGLQNGTLAIFVATQLFNDVTFTIPSATYALIMFGTSLIFVGLLRKKDLLNPYS